MNKFQQGTRDFVFEWTLNILILLFGTTTLVQAFIVPTPSMDSTVMVGDHLLVDKLSYAPSGPISKHLLPFTEPKRGDIIVFRYPRDPSKSFIKRVIGLAGDHIQIDAGRVFVNDKPIDEEYVPRAYEDERSYSEVVVPPDSYFVLGDHRSLSNDSRDFGPVGQNYIYGKAVFGYWPMDKMGRVR